MENLERILAEQPFLSGMKPEHFKLLAGCAKNVAFKAGEYLFHEGEPADSFYSFVRGRFGSKPLSPKKARWLFNPLKRAKCWAGPG